MHLTHHDIHNKNKMRHQEDKVSTQKKEMKTFRKIVGSILYDRRGNTYMTQVCKNEDIVKSEGDVDVYVTST